MGWGRCVPADFQRPAPHQGVDQASGKRLTQEMSEGTEQPAATVAQTLTTSCCSPRGHKGVRLRL